MEELLPHASKVYELEKPTGDILTCPRSHPEQSLDYTNVATGNSSRK